MAETHGADRPSMVALLAAELLREPDPMVQEFMREITDPASPYHYVADDLEASVRDNLVSVLTDLARQRDITVAFPRRTARRRAEEGVPLEAVLHSFGFAFRVIWRRMVETAQARGPDQVEELLRGGTVVWDAVDAYATVVAKEYRERVAQLARRIAQDRMAYVSGILDGRLSEWTIVSVAAPALGLDPDGRFVVVVADAAGDFGALPDLEDDLAREDVASAWTVRPDGVAGIVGVARSGPLERVVTLLRSPVGGRVGVSPPVQGLGQVVEAVALATVARNSLPPSRRGVAMFDDRLVAGLVAGGPPAVTARVVQAVLGGVLALGEDERDLLLETLQAWFDHGGSTRAAGSALFCHRNTVRNRLNRIQDVTGRDVNDPRHVAELHAALLAFRLSPDTPAAGDRTDG